VYIHVYVYINFERVYVSLLNAGGYPLNMYQWYPLNMYIRVYKYIEGESLPFFSERRGVSLECVLTVSLEYVNICVYMYTWRESACLV